MEDLKLYSKSEKDLDSLIQTAKIFNEDIAMQFRVDKCAMMVMKTGKIVKPDVIQLPNDKLIKSLKEREIYKYISVSEADEVIVNGMKDKVKKEYYRIVRKVLETRLNSGNVFKAINTWKASVVRYSAAFLGRSRLQLEEIDRRARKLLTMHNGFHPKSNVGQLYLSRSDSGRGLIGVHDENNFAVNKLCDKQQREIVNCCTYNRRR